MKKHFKALALTAAGLITAVSITACGTNNSSNNTTAAAANNSVTTAGDIDKKEVTVRIGAPKAPPTLPILKMMEDNVMGDKVKIKLENWDTPESLIGMVQDGQHDMFAFPLTVVAKLHNKGVGVKLMNVNTWGVSFLATTNPDVKTWSDLKGKTLYVTLQSSPVDAYTQYFLSKAGLKPGEDVNIIYATQIEIAQLMSAGKAENATLIEPQLTIAKTKNPNINIISSFADEWKKYNNDDSKLPTAGIGTTNKFAKENPEIVEKFNEEYKKALEWVKSHPAEAGKLAEEKLGINAKAIEKAMPNMDMEFKTAADADKDLKTMYKVLVDFQPQMIGGKVPDSGMYFSK